ncbi:MAG: TlpA family protein disulfide reductase [Odoribacteraceae bacterium]|jgi:thiol-disulfide isomerase/thioredoxin|nr:TlpA family protein disulfide reductase [Odoribacteraceae bacterium]
MKTILLLAALLVATGATGQSPAERSREQEGLRIHLERDLDKKEQAVDAYVKRFFPLKEGDNDPYARQIVSAALQHNIAREGNYALLIEYLPILPASVLPELYYRVVQLPWLHGTKDAGVLLTPSTAIRDEMIKRDPNPAEQHRAGFFVTHAEILHRVGEHAEAIEILEPLKESLARGASFNDLYARLLSANGYRHLLVPFIEDRAREDAATPAMLDTLRAFFLLEHPGGDFDARVASLRSPEHVERFEEHLLASLVDKELEPFDLENASGERVRVGRTGKVIVLDFWSTWCAPCKAALPGMQVAVNRFKDDPRVAFYFISTLEYDPNYKQSVRDFIASKGYEMEILYDDLDPATGKHGAIYHARARALGMNGIPHKAIIDANGRLRWSSGGYYGNPVELANEISFLVNHLLEEGK